MYILDTDHLTLLERQESANWQRLYDFLKPLETQVRTTIISFEEQMRGWVAYIRQAKKATDEIKGYKELRKHLHFYCELRILDFDEVAASKFQELRHKKLRIGTMDLKIAAITLANDGTLLSGNVRDFGKVPGLKTLDLTRKHT